MSAKMQGLLALVVTLSLLISYVVITVTGHDGTALLALLVGYIGGAAPAAIARSNTEAAEKG